MLSADEIKLKIETLEASAVKLGEPNGARYRELAMRWRLVDVEAVFMGAIQRTLADDEPV